MSAMSRLDAVVNNTLDKFAMELLQVLKHEFGKDLNQYDMLKILDTINVEDELRDRMSKLL
jgi:hypothetical protein